MLTDQTDHQWRLGGFTPRSGLRFAKRHKSGRVHRPYEKAPKKAPKNKGEGSKEIRAGGICRPNPHFAYRRRGDARENARRSSSRGGRWLPVSCVRRDLPKKTGGRRLGPTAAEGAYKVTAPLGRTSGGVRASMAVVSVS